jgi:hypothetical protein
LKKQSKPIIVAVLAGISAILISSYDLLGYNKALQLFFNDLGAQFIAEQYRVDRDRNAKFEPYVALIDDQYLAENDHGFIDYSGFGEILRMLGNLNVINGKEFRPPSIIFIDIAFIVKRKKDDISPLLEALETLIEEGRNTKIIFGAAHDLVGNSLIIEDLRIFREKHQESIFFASIHTDNNLARYYPALDSNFDVVYNTAAVEVFRQACRTQDSTQCKRNLRLFEEKKVLGIQVIWPRRPHFEYSRQNKLSSCQLGTSREYYEYLLFGSSDPNYCKNSEFLPFHETRKISHIRDHGFGNESFHSTLEDRIVFIGIDSVKYNNSYMHPLGIKIPPVYLHAMAFDNLMFSELNILSLDFPPWLKHFLEVATIFIVFRFLLNLNMSGPIRAPLSNVFGKSNCSEFWIFNKSSIMRNMLVSIIGVFLVFVISVLGWWIPVVIFNRAPINVMGIISTVVLALTLFYSWRPQ